MAKVICTLDNASLLISGVRFVEHSAGVISEEISDEMANWFASIKGYRISGAKKKDTTGADDPEKPPADPKTPPVDPAKDPATDPGKSSDSK